MQHPDHKYVEALKNNDRIMLDELYKKFSGKIKWMILKNHGTEAEAADIFQDALISIFNKATTQDFRLTCPLDAFLYLICKKKWLNELQRKRVNETTFIEDSGDTIGEDTFKLADEVANEEHRLTLITEKVDELGHTCKQLLTLSWGGKSMEEVAGLIGVTYGYARKKKSECMSKLAAIVKASPQFKNLQW